MNSQQLLNNYWPVTHKNQHEGGGFPWLTDAQSLNVSLVNLK